MKYDVVLLADKQDITSIGLTCIIGKIDPDIPILRIRDRKELIFQLEIHPASLVVFDYCFDDFKGIEEFLLLGENFPDSYWLLFSTDASGYFLSKKIPSYLKIGVILKDCSVSEIKNALTAALRNSEPYICKCVNTQLSYTNPINNKDIKILTCTEREILHQIALGKTTIEIASERFLSTHTIISHRKKIYKKLEVNNLQEATKEAFRMRIIDQKEFLS